jgi:hypothetical protein
MISTRAFSAHFFLFSVFLGTKKWKKGILIFAFCRLWVFSCDELS